MKFKLFEYIKEQVSKYQEAKEREEEQIKIHITDLLTRKWTKGELDSFNNQYAINTNFWLGPLTEEEAKKALLRENFYRFDEEERLELFKKIDEAQKELKR